MDSLGNTWEKENPNKKVPGDNKNIKNSELIIII